MMLQQTQVKTVIPYYDRFLRELPHWKALAKAKEERVLKLWEGLGYYRRARNLQAAARMVVADFGGRLPDTLEDILKLPGVGPYSAGAILSIAYQKPLPLVDGNVIRVFSRIFLLRGNLKVGEGHKRVWETAENLIPAKRPGDFNQALMELGATVCFSDNPQCLLCPLISHCQASRQGLQAELPEMPKAQETLGIIMAALFIGRKGRILVRKRSQEERWLKGLWEFPSAQGATFLEALRKLEKQTGAQADLREIQSVKHQITHHKIHLKLFPASLKGPGNPKGDFKWTTPKELRKLPFASAQNKLRAWALKAATHPPDLFGD
jgi:A/G-specific adenine glycosylase